MQKTLAMILLLAFGGYLAACLALFAFQRSLIYFPPQVPSLAAPRTSTLALPGAEVKVSERPRDGPLALIYLGGNAEDVTASLPLLDQAFPEHALYLMHYRGYLGSSGKPTEKALVADALALFDRVAAAHRGIVLVGRSLGSGVAIQVAAQRPVSGLVLVTPFDSLAALGAQQFPYLPVRWLLRDPYESGKHAPAVRAPTLIIAAGQDEIVPARSTALLLSRFPKGMASMKVVEGAGHNSIADSPLYVPYLRDGSAMSYSRK
jgi:pimeloyl-ACP methyl ester carboxylesterase